MDTQSSQFPGRLHWPNCHNVRDIGGLSTLGGSKTRHRQVVRADSLDRLNDAGMAAARGYGLGTIVDLRSPWELSATPHPFASDPWYRSVPFIDAERDHERDPAIERTRADLYRGSIDRNGRCIAAAVRAIVDAPPGVVVLHCLSGADRTGMLVALLLDALGVERPAIVRDYDRTHECLASLPDAASISVPEPETMPQTLRHLDERWGGSRAYLQRHGLTRDHLDALSTRLLAP
jgi:protein-tyrosine phosphatase